MNQQNQFPALSVSSEVQERLAMDLNVISTILNYGIIEIEQKNPRCRELQGIMVVKYTEIQDDDEMLMLDSGGEDITPADRYPHEVEGGTLVFVKNPYMRPARGTGNVAFLVDDNEPLPKGSLSGATHGWNREFLASHFDDGWWVIVDDDIRAEIEVRRKNIEDALKSQPQGVMVAGGVPVGDAQQDSVPISGDGVSPEDYQQSGQINAAPMMDPASGSGLAKPPGGARRRDGLPAGVISPNPAADARMGKLEKRMDGIDGSLAAILAAVKGPAGPAEEAPVPEAETQTTEQPEDKVEGGSEGEEAKKDEPNDDPKPEEKAKPKKSGGRKAKVEGGIAS